MLNAIFRLFQEVVYYVQYHLYADDTQLYVSFKVGDAVDLLEAQRRIEMGIAEIKAWMVMFMLKLNDDKTELVIIAPPYFVHHNKVPLSSVQVGDSGISTSKCARNIGVMFDHHMDMTTQVTKMCQAAWFQLRNIRSVRSSLRKEATLRLVCSLVRGVARVMNMCTHNASGIGLLIYEAFLKRRGCGFFLIHYCHFMGATPIHAARSSADTAGVRGPPQGQFEKKDRKWWDLVVFAVKRLINIFFYIYIICL